LEGAVISASNYYLSVVACVETAYFILILSYFHLSLEPQERQLPNEEFLLGVEINLCGSADTRHSVESVALRTLKL
jgi:hypothetical protein